MGVSLSLGSVSRMLSANGVGGQQGSSGAAFPVAPGEELGTVPGESRVCSHGLGFLLGPTAELSI